MTTPTFPADEVVQIIGNSRGDINALMLLFFGFINPERHLYLHHELDEISAKLTELEQNP